MQGSPCISKRLVCQVQYKVKTAPNPIQGVPLFVVEKNHPIQGIPCIGLDLFPNSRWRHFAIQGRPCIGFWLYYVMSQQYKVVISNTSW